MASPVGSTTGTLPNYISFQQDSPASTTSVTQTKSDLFELPKIPHNFVFENGSKRKRGRRRDWQDMVQRCLLNKIKYVEQQRKKNLPSFQEVMKNASAYNPIEEAFVRKNS